MKMVIDIDENVFTRLFDNGVDTSSEDRDAIDRAVRKGTVLSKEQGDLISREALKKELNFVYSCVYIESKSKEGVASDIIDLIDNAPTVLHDNYSMGYQDGVRKVLSERPQGECKTCRHRDPEYKTCDCGGLERQSCPFPVSDDYYCKYYEKDGAE